MSESRRLGDRWTRPELIVILDMYFNEGIRDSHGLDDVSRCMGRYSPDTNSYHDGAVNEKIAEAIGIVERVRRPRHPGDLIVSLVEEFAGDHPGLRQAARTAWREVLAGYTGGLPDFVSRILGRP